MSGLAAPLLAGAVAGFAIAVPIGPVGVLLVDTGVRHGLRVGLAAGLGVALADPAYASAAVIAGGAIAGVLAPVAEALRVVSAVVLVVVGVLLIRAALRRTDGPARSATPPHAGRTTLRFLALTIANPPTAIYFASLVLGLPAVAHGTPAYAPAAFALAAFLASLSWQSTMAGLGALLHHGLPGRASRATGVAGGVIVLALALRIVLAGLVSCRRDSFAISGEVGEDLVGGLDPDVGARVGVPGGRARRGCRLRGRRRCGGRRGGAAWW